MERQLKKNCAFVSSLLIALACLLSNAVLAEHSLAAGATGCVSISGNLDASSSIETPPDGIPTFSALNSAAQFSTFVDLFDSSNVPHSVTVYFFKLSSATSEVRLYADGGEVLGGVSGTPFLLGGALLSFDSGGQRISPPDSDFGVFPLWSNSATPKSVTFSFKNFTSLASASNIGAINLGCEHDPDPTPTPTPTPEPTPSPSPTPGPGASDAKLLDFDRDGLEDSIVFRPAFGMWYVRQSLDGSLFVRQWGLPGDVPIPGDYDGDRRPDLAVWRPTNGTWYFCWSAQNYDCTLGQNVQFGLFGDRPISADFDGDGKLDLAVWRPSNQSYYYTASASGVILSLQWGLEGDVPVPAPRGE